MRWLVVVLFVAIAIAFALAGAAYWARTIPVPSGRYHARGPARSPGDYPATGAFEGVRAVGEGRSALGRVAAIAADAPRTRRLAGSVSAGHVSFVTRTWLFGFPDVTNVWLDGKTLHVAGHLVVGRGDLGVNRRRILSWLDEAGLI